MHHSTPTHLKHTEHDQKHETINNQQVVDNILVLGSWIRVEIVLDLSY